VHAAAPRGAEDRGVCLAGNLVPVQMRVSEIRDVDWPNVQAGDLGQAQTAGIGDAPHGSPAVRQGRRQAVELLAAEVTTSVLGVWGSLMPLAGKPAGLGVDSGVERGP
jgi:hypothetical protein